MHFLPHYSGHLWPAAASAMAHEIDVIFLVWCIVLFFLVAPVFVFMAYCSVKYRAGRDVDRSHAADRNMRVEVLWIIGPFLVSLAFFFWAGTLYLEAQTPPPDAMTITAMGRQWMWKFQHPGGQSEINDLHVPVGVPVRVDIFSQDVVHSLYVPALRLQQEAVPGRTTQLWFKADRTGSYNMYCSEHCGSDHSLMAGMLVVMTPAGYQDWLRRQGEMLTLATAGRQVFETYGCSGCHVNGDTVRAPSLNGIFGQVVPLADGTTVTADAAYIRDSILEPKKRVVAGYRPVMPSFAGTIPDADLEKLVAYIESLGQSETTP